MLGTRRRDAGDKTLPRLPDTVTRLVSFTILTRARSGRMKTPAIRVVTTLLDPNLYRQASSPPCTQGAGRQEPRSCT